MLLIVQIGYCNSQRLDAGSGSVFAAIHGDIDGLGSLERSGDIIIYLGCTLTQIGPEVGGIEEAMVLQNVDVSG